MGPLVPDWRKAELSTEKPPVPSSQITSGRRVPHAAGPRDELGVVPCPIASVRMSESMVRPSSPEA